jgi:hypothetical protein
MDQTRLLQLACRGAAELSNDPLKAFAGVTLDDMRAKPRRQLTKAQRERAMAQAGAFYDNLVAIYRG